MKVKFLKSIRYKTDGGLMRTASKAETIEFFDEERVEEILYDGFARLTPEHFPSSAKYRIIGPWPVTIDGNDINVGTVVTLNQEQAAELCSQRRAEPLSPDIWVPGRGKSAGEARKLYEDEK
jgi:hypothetical protein